MTLQEIKDAVNAGKTVYVGNECYTVLKDSKDQWFIHFGGSSCRYLIGLTWADGVTLNDKEENFYIGG